MRPTISEAATIAGALTVLLVASVTAATRGEDTTTSTGALSTATPTPSKTAKQPPARQQDSKMTAPTTAAPKQTSPPAASGSTTPPATVKRPAPGTYDYTETDSDGTRTSTLKISSRGGGRQVEDTDSGSVIDEVDWRSDAKYDLATTFSFPNGSVRCDWSPDFTEYRYPLRRGATWKVQTSCHPNATTSISLSGTVRVVSQQQEAVGGVRVATWTLVIDATVTFSGNGSSFSDSIRDEDHFAPAYGLTVREIETSSGRDPSGQQSQHKTTRELRSLRPS